VIVLVAGPSGAGKSTIIRALMSKDARYTHIPVAVTREIRDDEIGKFRINEDEIVDFSNKHDVIFRNDLYGVTYLTVGDQITGWLDQRLIPIIDWPIDHVGVFKRRFGDSVVVIYIRPEADGVLADRLANRQGRVARISAGVCELERLDSGSYRDDVDMIFVNTTNEEQKTAADVERWINTRLAEGDRNEE
jgi:guanylate kinase